MNSKRKRGVSETERPPRAIKVPRTTDREPEQNKLSTYLLSIPSLPGWETPASYSHGPRYESQSGPLVPYSSDAAMLKGKLLALEIDKRELDKNYDAASGMHKDARRRLRLHCADRRCVPGCTEKEHIVTTLQIAENAMDRARSTVEKRRILLKVDEEAEAEGWGVASMADWY